MVNHAGHFDDHIAKSIPTFRETQARKGHAIINAFKGEHVRVLDIGGSEGSWAKALAAMAPGRIEAHVLDPNEHMADFFQKKSQVPGAKFIRKGYMNGWQEEDGTTVDPFHADTTTDRYDVVHETMVFQFISNNRETQVAEAKRLLKPGGLFLSEEKLMNDQWKPNEDKKDRLWKNRYYSDAELAAKQAQVGFTDTKKEQKGPSMLSNMVTQKRL